MPDEEVRLSGWCSPAPGAKHTEYEHRNCHHVQTMCQCKAFGGHGDRDSA